MAYSFEDAKAPSSRRTQYFEMFGNRAIYSDGWVAATTPLTAPWSPIAKKADPVHGCEWELYNIAEDFSQSNNLAAKHPDKLQELQLLFYGEAQQNNVLPVDSTKVPRLDVSLRPSLTKGRSEFTYYDGMRRIPEGMAPDFKNKSHTITAEIEIGEGDSDGMLVTQGGRFSPGHTAGERGHAAHQERVLAICGRPSVPAPRCPARDIQREISRSPGSPRWCPEAITPTDYGFMSFTHSPA